MSLIVLSAIILGVIFGVLGIAIAKNKRVTLYIGFFIGFFLGPIGLIILALLNPTVETCSQSQRFDSDHDLSSDAYRLWLTNKYRITKNETLGRYVVGSNSYADLDEALNQASFIEDRQIEIEAINAEKAAITQARALRGIVVAVGLTAIFFVGRGFFDYVQQKKALQVANAAIEMRRKSIAETLKGAGISLIPTASMSSIDHTSLSVKELESQSFIDASVLPVVTEDFGFCSVKIKSVWISDPFGKEVKFYNNGTVADTSNFYKNDLAKAGYSMDKTFIHPYLDRVSYKNDHNIVFMAFDDSTDHNVGVKMCILSRKSMDTFAKFLKD